MVADMKNRIRTVREDSKAYRYDIRLARRFIYNDGFGLKSAAVERLLKDCSLVATEVRFSNPLCLLRSSHSGEQNAFSATLSDYGFDFFKMLRVNLLHEVELGLFKNVFAHLIRILEARGDQFIHEVNSRSEFEPFHSSFS